MSWWSRVSVTTRSVGLPRRRRGPWRVAGWRRPSEQDAGTGAEGWAGRRLEKSGAGRRARGSGTRSGPFARVCTLSFLAPPTSKRPASAPLVRSLQTVGTARCYNRARLVVTRQGASGRGEAFGARRSRRTFSPDRTFVPVGFDFDGRAVRPRRGQRGRSVCAGSPLATGG